MKNALGIAHEIARKHIKIGDIVIDATAGNGNDTLLLAKLVGDKGKVYAFDIQKAAIINTKEKLRSHGLECRVRLINDGHQYMDRYISENISLVMFNLGYLPGGNHQIATKADSTIKALKISLNLLQLGGIIMMVIYQGGHSGFTEKDAIMEYLGKLNYNRYTVLAMDFLNWINYPPIAVCIEKIK